MTQLVEMTLFEYLDILKSKEPAPGGGSVSALAGAQGIALLSMVTDLTLGKDQFADSWEICKKAKKGLKPLFEALVENIDRDTEAFNLVAAAFKMPKITEDDKKARKEAIQAGTLASTEVPFRTMELAMEGLKLADTILEHSNPNCSSDLGVGVANLEVCVKGAWLNVLINLPGIKDEQKVSKYREEGQLMVEKAEEISKRCFGTVEKSLSL